MSEPSLATDVAAPQLTVEQAIANLRHQDTSLRYYAAWWLGKFRIQDPAAVDALILALTDEEDRTELGGYPLRRNAARALGKLGDPRAVPELIQCLTCSDFYVREAAAQALGQLQDRRAVEPLMHLLSGGVEANQQVPGRPHLTQPCEAVMEALGQLQATEAIALIQPFTAHPVERVRYAAARGADLKLRRVALSDLGATGYLPAADAIAQAPVENSFKLLALKGILEHQVGQSSSGELTDATIRVMHLMDSLL
ncbi:MAG: HEAT repeat domain-containing protein [Cyanobacteria bacterium FC1]|nr:HEAT repeat domain-containing protein [Cyanobacteria bacterium FC1]